VPIDRSGMKSILGARERDVAERTRQRELWAGTGALTDLISRRTCDGRLSSERIRAKRLGRPLSIFCIDVDHFRLVNDAFGHSVGDEVLATIVGPDP
jgi:diguanylate cyclase (GGDEF)-like protein